MRRTLLPLAMLAMAFAAFGAAAWTMADGNDLAGIYLIVVALVTLRAQTRITAAVTA